MSRLLLILGLCWLNVAPGLADETDYAPYWAHLSDVRCPHFVYDCGGYIDLGVKGTFAYAVSEHIGLEIIDVSDPVAPVHRGSLDLGWQVDPGRLSLQDHYVFLSRRPTNDIAIIDVDDADAPALVGLIALPSEARDLLVIGRKLYVATAAGPLRIYDTDAPTQPQYLLSLTPPVGALRELALDGNRLYAAGDGGLAVYGVSSPASPTLLGSLAMDGGELNALAAQDNLVLAAQGNQTRIIDASDPQAIEVLGAIPGWAFGLLLVDGEAWIGTQEYCWQDSGLDIWDLADPAQPQLRYQDGYDLRGGPLAMVERQGLVYAAEWMCWCAGEWPGFHVYRRGVLPLPPSLAELNLGSGCSLLGRGDLIYVGTSSEILAYDLAEPDAPVPLGSFGAGRATVRLTASGDRLLAIEQATPRRLQFYDLIATWEPLARGYVAIPPDARETATVGDDVLVAGGSGGGLVVIDASDPDAPVVVATHFPGESVHSVAAAGNLVAVSVAAAEVRLLDVSAPTSPSPLGVIPADLDVLRDELQFLDLADRRYLLCAVNDNTSWYELADAAEIWDVTDPLQPVRVLNVPLLALDYCRSLAWRDGVLYIQGDGHLTMYAWSGTDEPHGLLGRVVTCDYFTWGSVFMALTDGAVVEVWPTGLLDVWPLQSRSLTAVAREPIPAPTALSLRVSPNPFNPRTRLGFTLPASGRADLAVYDLAGRLVRRLESGELPAGDHVRVWSGDDDAGRSLPSGTYVARLATAAGVETRTLVLVR